MALGSAGLPARATTEQYLGLSWATRYPYNELRNRFTVAFPRAAAGESTEPAQLPLYLPDLICEDHCRTVSEIPT
jgi:hypothetical protein